MADCLATRHPQDCMKGLPAGRALRALGVMPSFSRPAVSNDNPFSESLFKTLKYRPSYPRRPFEDLTAARQWVNRFVYWYNHEHRHCAIGFVTPEQRSVQACIKGVIGHPLFWAEAVRLIAQYLRANSRSVNSERVRTLARFPL